MAWEPIKNEIPKIRIDPNAPMTIAKSPRGNLYVRGEMIRIPEALVVLEDFAPGATVKWCFDNDEVQYILNGKAEMTYRLPYDLYNEAKTMTVEAGDCYFFPSGSEIEWKIDPSGPYQKLCIIMPGIPPRELPPDKRYPVSDYSEG